MLMHPEIHRAVARAHFNDLLAAREPRFRRPSTVRRASRGRVQRHGLMRRSSDASGD